MTRYRPLYFACTVAAGLVREPLVVEDVVRVMVRVQDELDRVPVLPRDLLEDPRVEARVDDRPPLRFRVRDQVPEVRHLPDPSLFEEHPRPPRRGLI